MRHEYRSVPTTFTLVILQSVLLAGAAMAQIGTGRGDKTPVRYFPLAITGLGGPLDSAGRAEVPRISAAGGGIEAADPGALLAGPSNVTMEKTFRPFVERLLLCSPTFRQQFQRVRETKNLRIEIHLVAPRELLAYRARCHMEKAGSAISVRMEIVALRPIPEALGHEFEHVVEQLEGLNLAVLADTKASGVIRQPDGSYETIRAIAAGKAVAQEYFSFSHQK